MFGFVTVLKFRGGTGKGRGCRGEAGLGGNEQEAKRGTANSPGKSIKGPVPPPHVFTVSLKLPGDDWLTDSLTTDRFDVGVGFLSSQMLFFFYKQTLLKELHLIIMKFKIRSKYIM